MRKKVLKYVCVCIGILVSILLVIFILKFNKVNSIFNLMQKNNEELSNYSFIINNTQTCKIKDDVSVTYFTKMENEQKLYRYPKENKMYDVNENEKSYKESEMTYIPINNFELYDEIVTDYSFKNKIKCVFDWKIKNYKDDNSYYDIKFTDENNNSIQVIINKSNGYLLKVGDKNISDFAIDNVKDSDVILPDFSEYNEL